ncbi:hypothetical protein JXA05_03560 [Candidatus Peregrinibacteria bacterium]|nr:hypothetical protein [Candidatus Peregrinibacteria bacterium]
MMSTYIFILGKDRELSFAELKACYPRAKLKAEGDDFAVFDTDEKIDQAEFNRLGGCLKAGKANYSVSRAELPDALARELANRHSGSKLDFAVSVYGWPEKNLRPLLVSLRKAMSAKGLSSRFANQKFLNLSVPQHKGIGKKGIEFIVARSGERFFVGPVIAVQDIDGYSRRDYGKPFRNMKVGMLPPKLAQIMINLTGVKEGKVWDPFCGTGTLVMEGLLMGHDMLGSDVDPKVLDGAKKNADWLVREFGVKNKAEFFVHDATRPMRDKIFGAIAAEGYLGPPQPPHLEAGRLSPLVVKLEKLYVDFFRALKEAGCEKPVVIAMPFFRCAGGKIVDLKDATGRIASLGFLVQGSYRYARPDQSVGRLITCFSRKCR